MPALVIAIAETDLALTSMAAVCNGPLYADSRR
jgi:hypothetical protein